MILKIFGYTFAVACGLANYLLVIGGIHYYRNIYPSFFEKNLVADLLGFFSVILSIFWPILCWFAMFSTTAQSKMRYDAEVRRMRSEQIDDGNAGKPPGDERKP